MAKGKISIHIIALGFLVLLFWGIFCFWADFLCRNITGDLIDAGVTCIIPKELIDSEMITDLDIKPPSFTVYFSPGEIQGTALGIMQNDSLFEPDRFLLQEGGKDWKLAVYVDPQTHQIRFSEFTEAIQKDKERVYLYAGPDGLSEVPSETIGRFEDPILYGDWDRCFIYDRKIRRFFRIDIGPSIPVRDESGRVIEFKLGSRELVKGPALAEDGNYQPVRMGKLEKGPGLWINFNNPARRVVKEEDYGGYAGHLWKEYDDGYQGDTAANFLLVMDQSGRIDRLDSKTLEFAGTAGRLPSLKGLFGSQSEGLPDKVSAYRVYPISRKEGDKVIYKGCCIATASSDGFGRAIQFFDSEGRAAGICRDTDPWRTEMSGKDSEGRIRLIVEGGRLTKSIFEKAGGPLLMVIRFLVENLQPPIFSMASFAAADAVEGRAGFRALFVRPNGFAGILGRVRELPYWSRSGFALLMILPSLLLGMILGWSLRKKVLRLGYSARTGMTWFILGILLGIPACITFALIRNREVMVTCANCGSLRRPDQDRCHACRAVWDLRHLDAPVWRVLEPIDVSRQGEKETIPDTMQSEEKRL